MSFHAIRTISFDVTGTLIDPFPSIGAIYAEVLHRHGLFLTEADLEMRFMSAFHKSRMEPLEPVSEKAEKARWQTIIQNILLEHFSEEIFEDLWLTLGESRHWKPKPRLFRTLESLLQDGFDLIVVSNWDARLHGLLSALKLTPYFSRVFISTEVGLEKPSPAFFQTVAGKLGAASETLLHVGNSQAEDYRPALRSDWNALLLNNRIPYGMEPGAVLGSIDQLPEVLQSERAAS
ncbi:MAG: HAD-IA family hydrolase [Verrucomicrobiae bacterium]|nr:HAD-IA family hydrolase [Verrucomicrobiae bacterium]